MCRWIVLLPQGPSLGSFIAAVECGLGLHKAYGFRAFRFMAFGFVVLGVAIPRLMKAIRGLSLRAQGAWARALLNEGC